MTGANRVPEVLQGKGATDILAKPVDPTTLLETVGRLLGEPPPA